MTTGASLERHNQSVGAAAASDALVGGATDASPLRVRPAKWTVYDGMPMPVFEAGASIAAEGWLVVTGGFDADLKPTRAIQLHHRDRGWRPIGTHLAMARARHTQTTLGDGRILVVGGVSRYPLGATAEEIDRASLTAEVFDPLAASTTILNLDEPLVGHSAHLLPDGRVAVVGGGAVRIFDPRLDAFTQRIRLRLARRNHTAVLWRGSDDSRTPGTGRPSPSSPTAGATDGDEAHTKHPLVSSLVVRTGYSADFVHIFSTKADAATVGEPDDGEPGISSRLQEQIQALLDSSRKRVSPLRYLLIVGGDPQGAGAIEEVDLIGGRSYLWNQTLAQPVIDAAAGVVPDGDRVFLCGGYVPMSAPIVSDSALRGRTIDWSWWINSDRSIEPGPALQYEQGIAGHRVFVQERPTALLIVGGELRRPGQVSAIAAPRWLDVRAERMWALRAYPDPFLRRAWFTDAANRPGSIGGYRFIGPDQSRRTEEEAGIQLSDRGQHLRVPNLGVGD